MAAVVFMEPRGEGVVPRIRGEMLHAPSLLSYELASVGLKKIRSEPAQRAVLRARFEIIPTIEIELHEVQASEVLDLAIETGLTAYDASYLWLAEHLGLELVTLDRRLQRATDGRS